jgi:hypothetical protein
MSDTRRKNVAWTCCHSVEGKCLDADLAVLMDIRDELQALNRLLNCPNFTRIPHTLHEIRRSVTKRRYKKRK